MNKDYEHIDFSGLYNQDPINLKIYDNEYLNCSSKYLSIGENLENICSNYVKTLNELSKALSGNFANNIEHFSEDVNFYLKDTIQGIMRSVSSNMNNYITEIDNKDGKMY